MSHLYVFQIIAWLCGMPDGAIGHVAIVKYKSALAMMGSCDQDTDAK